VLLKSNIVARVEPPTIVKIDLPLPSLSHTYVRCSSILLRKIERWPVADAL